VVGAVASTLQTLHLPGGLMMIREQRRYLTVGQAAVRLGVSPQSVRNWGAAGVLREIRHPINGYRLYSPTEVRDLAQRLPESPGSRGHA
jgi:hypothetical protein